MLPDDTCPHCGHEWRRHDPVDGRCDAHSAEQDVFGPCRCGRDVAFTAEANARLSQGALAARSPQGEDHEAGEWELTFTLAEGRTEDDALALYERVEADPATAGAALSRVSPSRDGSVAVEDVARLVEALRPFVAAYDAVGRTFCPEFNGPEALAHFDRAAEVLAEFSPASTSDHEENDERRP